MEQQQHEQIQTVAVGDIVPRLPRVAVQSVVAVHNRGSVEDPRDEINRR